MSEQERIEHARWILERNIAWIAQTEVKVAVVISLDAAMLSTLAAAYTTATGPAKTSEAITLSVLCGIVLLAAFVCSFMVVKPRIGGPDSSFIFFGKVVKKDRVVFTEDFAKASTASFLSDLTDQIHRNAEIACDKHEWVRKAAMWSFVAGAFWTPALALLVKS